MSVKHDQNTAHFINNLIEGKKSKKEEENRSKGKLFGRGGDASGVESKLGTRAVDSQVIRRKRFTTQPKPRKSILKNGRRVSGRKDGGSTGGKGGLGSINRRRSCLEHNEAFRREHDYDEGAVYYPSHYRDNDIRNVMYVHPDDAGSESHRSSGVEGVSMPSFV